MKPEQALYQLIKPHLPGFVNRIENAAGTGMPDVLGLAAQSTYWLELKVYNGKETVETILRPAQKIWHKKATIAGARVFVLIRDNDDLVLMTLSYSGYHQCLKLHKPWNWMNFTDRLLNA